MAKIYRCSDKCRFYNHTSDDSNGICTAGDYFVPTKIGNECPLVSEKEYKCGDCQHLVSGDSACMTAREEDSIMHEFGACGGFDNKYMCTIIDNLYELYLHGEDLELLLFDIKKNLEDYASLVKGIRNDHGEAEEK